MAGFVASKSFRDLVVFCRLYPYLRLTSSSVHGILCTLSLYTHVTRRMTFPGSISPQQLYKQNKNKKPWHTSVFRVCMPKRALVSSLGRLTNPQDSRMRMRLFSQNANTNSLFLSLHPRNTFTSHTVLGIALNNCPWHISTLREKWFLKIS